MIGAKLAHFELTNHLGSGGMGDVYQATDTKLGRNVAIKFLPEEFSHDSERVVRFQREARVLASLNHPNIAAIYGVDEINGRHLLVMELVPGETLGDRIRRGPVRIEEALLIAKQMAEALEEAHEKGIVHRDLKPANLKITSEGRLKVLDFGLAKALHPTAEGNVLADSSTLSIAGVIRGTAAYMSPEQAQGLTGDERSDLFSFGCVLYELLTGRRVFAGETVVETLGAVLEREPDFSALPRDLNPRIRDLLRRCLEKNPKRRWHAAADLRAEIEAILSDPRGVVMRPETSATKQPHRAILLVSAIIVAAILGGAVMWSLRPSSPPPMITRLSFSLPEGQQFTNPTRQMVSISPDGTQIVYAANDRLYLKSMNSLQPVAVQGTESLPGVQNPIFSPDGKQFVMLLPDIDRSKASESPQIQFVLNWFSELQQRSSAR
jgi:eukaryotic-like serine/threonine-protein kinase